MSSEAIAVGYVRLSQRSDRSTLGGTQSIAMLPTASDYTNTSVKWRPRLTARLYCYIVTATIWRK